MRILIVEDDTNLAEVLSRFFANHETRTVTKLSDALLQVREYEPDLVILDCLLDDTTSAKEAIDAIPQMRQSSPTTAVLVYTGVRDDLLKAYAIAQGAVGLVQKNPIRNLIELKEDFKEVLCKSAFPHLIQELENAIGCKL